MPEEGTHPVLSKISPNQSRWPQSNDKGPSEPHESDGSSMTRTSAQAENRDAKSHGRTTPSAVWIEAQGSLCGFVYLFSSCRAVACDSLDFYLRQSVESKVVAARLYSGPQGDW